MYGRHSQAIGRNPLDAPQPDVLSAMQRIEPTKKRFKPHRADQLAVEPDVITSAPPLSKGEVIQFPGNPKPTQEQARPAGVTPISGGPLSHDYGHLLPPHLKKAGWQLSVDKLPAGVPSVVARLKNRRGLLIGSGWHRANGDFATAGIAPQEHLLRALEEHGRLDKAEKSETMYCTACKDPLDKDGHCNVKSHWPLLDASKKKLDKAEADGVKKKPTPCRCPRWSFPHRTGSCAKK